MSILHKIFKQLNSKEFWPVWIGFSWFIIMITIRIIFNTGPLDLKVWYYDTDFINQFSDLRLGISLIIITLFTVFTVSICHYFLKQNISYVSYSIIFLVVFLSKYFGTFSILKNIGLGTSFWCIIIGCLLRFALHNYTDNLLNGIMSMEFFIKCGIVLFAIDIQEIAVLGGRGIVVGWVETILLLTITFTIGIYIIRMSHVETLLISSGLSICGSSAIMALSEIVNAESEDINTSITILSVFTIPYISIMPIICKHYGFSDIFSGIWIGGTVDSTGAVIASASLLNKNALNSAIVLKMLQNIIIGPITLCITGIWHNSVNPKILWHKFPKFIIGFFITSLTVSVLPNPSYRENITNDCFILSEWFSNISFVIIGLEIDLYGFKNIFQKKWKMIVLYIIGQNIDVFTTLGFDFLMFKN
jgi:uncharacterized integral membrane protein (TIGR00698 family)